jgi:anti-sigma factor RsiW
VLVCRDISEMTTDYLDDALPWGKRLAMRLHLSICGMCRRHLEQVRQTMALLRLLPRPPVAEMVEDTIIARAAEPGPAAPDDEGEPEPGG